MQVDRGDQLPLGVHCRISIVVQFSVTEGLCHVDCSLSYVWRMQSACKPATTAEQMIMSLRCSERLVDA